MERNQRKVGRPKAPARTGPLVLGEDYARTKVTLEISERAAEELVEYTRWVEKWSNVGAARGEVQDDRFALREIFRRDRVWQAQRRKPPELAPTPASASPPAPPAGSSQTPSSSLPPPSGPRTAANTASGPSRGMVFTVRDGKTI
jgi:hypothetical protein